MHTLSLGTALSPDEAGGLVVAAGWAGYLAVGAMLVKQNFVDALAFGCVLGPKPPTWKLDPQHRIRHSISGRYRLRPGADCEARFAPL